jgi:hypothetical protein
MKTQFISTNIQRSAESKEEVFSDYLMERIFGRIESAAMNNETGAFTLTFAEEQKISLKNLPKGKSQAVLGALKPAVGKTLHVAKEVKGKFNYLDEGRPSFEDGSLTIQWQRMWLNFTAHLTGIFTQDQDPELLIVAGKIAFLTEKRAIRAQDFVDFLECNMPK